MEISTQNYLHSSSEAKNNKTLNSSFQQVPQSQIKNLPNARQQMLQQEHQKPLNFYQHEQPSSKISHFEPEINEILPDSFLTSNQIPNTSQAKEKIYSDDDPIMINPHNKNQFSYNLEKGLSLEVKSMHKCLKFSASRNQTIPVMVSIKTLGTTEESAPSSLELVKKQQYETHESSSLPSSRQTIDLICVIDTSSSMQGWKIKQVQKSLNILLGYLGENDRLCLVCFNSQASRLTNLLRITNSNRGLIQEKIDSLVASGGTVIHFGMKIALQVIQNRRFINNITSIFLLSDGQDDYAEKGVKNIMEELKMEQSQFSIHSFGYGQDHDAKMMNTICQIKGGNFYYVENIEQIDEFFIDAIGGLFSVVAQEVEIEVFLNLQDPQVNMFFQQTRITKTFRDMWKPIKKRFSYRIKVNQLLSGVSKDFVFELTVPPLVVNSIRDSARNAEIIKVNLVAIPASIVAQTTVTKEAKLMLTLFTNEEKIMKDSEVNDAVEFNYLRVKASEAMEQAISNADQQKYQESQDVLQRMIININNAHPKNQAKLQVIKNDLLVCQENSKEKNYSQATNQVMYGKMNANYNQSSQAVNVDDDLYQNSVQERMVRKQQAYKSDIIKNRKTSMI